MDQKGENTRRRETGIWRHQKSCVASEWKFRAENKILTKIWRHNTMKFLCHWIPSVVSREPEFGDRPTKKLSVFASTQRNTFTKEHLYNVKTYFVHKKRIYGSKIRVTSPDLEETLKRGTPNWRGGDCRKPANFFTVKKLQKDPHKFLHFTIDCI